MDAVYNGGMNGRATDFNRRVLIHIRLFDGRQKCIHCFNTVYYALVAFEKSFPDNPTGLPSYFVEDRYDLRPLILLLAFIDSQRIAEVLYKTPLSLMCQTTIHSEAPLVVFNALMFFYKLVSDKRDASNVGLVIPKIKFGVHHSYQEVLCWLLANEITIAEEMFSFASNAMIQKATLCGTSIGCEFHACAGRDRHVPTMY
jgi:hypothetical protein